MATSTLQLLKHIHRDQFDIRIALCADGPYADLLRKNDERFDILASGWPPLLRRQVDGVTRRSWSGCMRFPSWLLRTVRVMAAYVRAHDIDVIHSNYHHFHLVAGVVARLTGRKCVLHWRGIMRGRAFRRVSPLLRRLLGKQVWSIANSRATLESVKALAGVRSRVIYNGLVLGKPNSLRAELRSILGIPANARIVGLVGTVYERKGQIYLLEAASDLCRAHRDLQIVFIGPPGGAGRGEYLEMLLAKRDALGLNDRVHFLGRRADAAELVAGFDIAAVCTIPPGEGFGLVIIEAMAQAVPVVSSNVGAATEILANNETGLLIPPADSKALGAAIHTLLSDDATRQRLGQAGLESCRQRFDIGRTADEVETVYRQVLGC